MTTMAISANRLSEFRPALKSFANVLCGDSVHAEDLVQETMLKAWVARESYCDDNCKAWLFTIMRNHYYSELRHRKLERSYDYAVSMDDTRVHESCEQRLEVRDVLRAMMQLPSDQRAAMLLVCSDGLSYDEAAKACRCAVGTIKSRVARAREKLSAIYL